MSSNRNALTVTSLNTNQLGALREVHKCSLHSLRSLAVEIPKSGHEKWTLSRALTTDERSTLSRIGAEIDALLQPSTPQEIAKAVGPLWLNFGTGGVDIEEQEARAALYVDVLNEFPAWLIRDVVNRYLRNKIPGQSTTFAPTATAVAEQAGKLRNEVCFQKWEVVRLKDAIEPAPTMSEEAMAARREQIAALMAGTLKPIGGDQ